VKLLYARRAYPDDFRQLLDGYRPGQNPEAKFKQGDDLAWARLDDAVQHGRVKIECANDSVESLSPTKFSLSFGDPALADSYLIRYVLAYEWSFKLTPEQDRSWFPRKPRRDPGELTS
jgi:hypothetical protein